MAMMYFRWNKERVEYLRANFRKMPVSEMAFNLGTSHISVRNKLIRLGLKAPRRQYWTKAREAFLVKNYRKMSVEDLAAELGVSARQVKMKLAYMDEAGKASPPKPPEAGFRKKVKGYLMEFDGRNWRQIGKY